MTSDKAVDDRFSSIGTVEFNRMRYILQEEVDIVLIYGERHQSLQEKALLKKHQAKRLCTALSLAIQTDICAYI